MSATERKLRGLKNRKRSIVTSFTGIKQFVADYESERDELEVPVRLENLIALWDEFNNVQTELETGEDDDDILEVYLKERLEFERIYYRTKGTLLQWSQTTSTVNAMSQQAVEMASQARVKLPDIKLPIFSGKFENWLNFHDLFLSLVHSSPNLSTIQKFYYLRSSLDGEALKLIQTIPISNEQYSVAWNLLKDHYQNPRRLKRIYVQSLFDLPVMQRETAADLHSLVEKFQINVKVLKQMGERTEHWDVLLIQLLSSRLDTITKRSWEEYSEINGVVEFEKLIEFLQHRVNVLETVGDCSTAAQPNAKRMNGLRSYGATVQNIHSCPACSNQHYLYQCEEFFGMTFDEKESFVQRHQLCRNCLRRGHMEGECSSDSSCRKCGGRHHTKLCRKPRKPSSNNFASTVHTGVTSCITQESNRVLLGTANIIMVDESGKEHRVRALLDSGSECCFASEQLAQRMKILPCKVNMPISGIGQAVTTAHYKFRALVKSRITNYSTAIEAIILPKVTVDLPTFSVDVSSWNLPTGIHLADPAFNVSSPIDVVLGAEIFFELFDCNGHISLGDSLPSLKNSAFGWIVSGTAYKGNGSPSVVCNMSVTNKETKASRRDSEVIQHRPVQLDHRRSVFRHQFTAPPPLIRQLNSTQHTYRSRVFIRRTFPKAVSRQRKSWEDHIVTHCCNTHTRP